MNDFVSSVIAKLLRRDAFKYTILSAAAELILGVFAVTIGTVILPICLLCKAKMG